MKLQVLVCNTEMTPHQVTRTAGNIFVDGGELYDGNASMVYVGYHSVDMTNVLDEMA